MNQFGVTVGQSLGSHLVIASTLRLVAAVWLCRRARSPTIRSMPRTTSTCRRRPRPTSISARWRSFGRMRLGIAIKHATRAGVRRGRESPCPASASPRGRGICGARARSLSAVDADLTRTATAFGDAVTSRRALKPGCYSSGSACGAASARTRWETRALSASTGLSVAVRSRAYIDAALTAGSDRSREGWNLGLRVTF